MKEKIEVKRANNGYIILTHTFPKPSTIDGNDHWDSEFENNGDTITHRKYLTVEEIKEAALFIQFGLPDLPVEPVPVQNYYKYEFDKRPQEKYYPTSYGNILVGDIPEQKYKLTRKFFGMEDETFTFNSYDEAFRFISCRIDEIKKTILVSSKAKVSSRGFATGASFVWEVFSPNITKYRTYVNMICIFKLEEMK